MQIAEYVKLRLGLTAKLHPDAAAVDIPLNSTCGDACAAAIDAAAHLLAAYAAACGGSIPPRDRTAIIRTATKACDVFICG